MLHIVNYFYQLDSWAYRHFQDIKDTGGCLKDERFYSSRTEYVGLNDGLVSSWEVGNYKFNWYPTYFTIRCYNYHFQAEMRNWKLIRYFYPYPTGISIIATREGLGKISVNTGGGTFWELYDQVNAKRKDELLRDWLPYV